MKINLLDTTLRDGSYVNDFSFTRDDTSAIVRALDCAGVRYVEVGHGVGLNASEAGKGSALHTDVEYIESAVRAARHAAVGVFCIPGIAHRDNVRAAADVGLAFVRVGVNATEVEKSKELIRLSKRLGLKVFTNYMKAHTVSPEKFAEQACRSEDYGADAVYIVDSAGGMFPEQISEYYEAVRRRSDIAIGFHGHNNLGMAISNSLRAVELGASYVDMSLQGLGRSAGNAAAEILVACLAKRYGYRKVSFLDLIEISQRYIVPLRLNQVIPPLDVVAGYAGFHSSYMKDIQRAASRHSVDPLELMMAYAEVDATGMDVSRLDGLAARMRRRRPLFSEGYDFSRYYGHEQN